MSQFVAEYEVSNDVTVKNPGQRTYLENTVAEFLILKLPLKLLAYLYRLTPHTRDPVRGLLVRVIVVVQLLLELLYQTPALLLLLAHLVQVEQ